MGHPGRDAFDGPPTVLRGKQDGLLVGYAPLTDSLKKALAEYSPSDQRDQTLGRDVDRAITEVRNEYSTIHGLLAGVDWRALLADTSHPRPRRRPLRRVADHLRDPRTPGNRVGREPRRSRCASGRAPRGWSASTGCAR